MFADAVKKMMRRIRSAWEKRSRPKLDPNRWRYYDYLK
jgi:hypothetical protein